MPGVIDELFIEIRYRDDRRGLRRVRRRGVRAARAIDQAFDKSARGMGQNFQRAGRDAQRSIQRLERQVDNSTGRVDDHFETMAARARVSQQRIATDAVRQSGRFERAWQGASQNAGAGIAAFAGAIAAVGAGATALGAQLEQAQAGRALLTAPRRAQAERLDRAVGDRLSVDPSAIARSITRLTIGLGTREFEERDVLNAAQLSALLTAQDQELDQRTIGQGAVLAERIGIDLAPILQTILDIGQQTGIDPNFIQEQAFEGAQTAGVQTLAQFEQFLSAAVSEVIRTGDVARLVQVGDEILLSSIEGPRAAGIDPNFVTTTNQAEIAARQGVDIRIRGQDELDELIASMTAAQEAIGPISAAAADAQTSFAPLIGIIEVIARLFGALPGPIQSVVTIGGTLGVVTLGLNFLLGAQGGLLFSTVIPAMVSYATALFSTAIPATIAFTTALLANPIVLIGVAIAAVIIGLIALEARFGFLTAIFNKFRRAFSFIPGISAPDDDEEDERRAPRGGSAGGTQPQEQDERTIIESRLSRLQYRRTSIGISVEGQQEIDDLEQRLASLPDVERTVSVQVAETPQQPAQPNVAQQRGFVEGVPEPRIIQGEQQAIRVDAPQTRIIQQPAPSMTIPIVPSPIPHISAAVPRVAPGPGNRIVINVPNLQVFNDITLDGAGDPAEVAAALEDVTGEGVRAAISEIADERIHLDNARVLSLTPRNRTI